MTEPYLTNAELGFLKMVRYFDRSMSLVKGVIKGDGVLGFGECSGGRLYIFHAMPIRDKSCFLGLEKDRFYYWTDLCIPYWQDHNPLEY